MGVLENAISLIAEIGFPIAAFLLMWNLANKTIKENTEILKELKFHIHNLKGGGKK